MSESTVTKSKVFKEDLSLATGGTSAVETGTRLTSTGGEITLTKLDAAHIKFRSLAKSPEDLIDGGKDVEIKPSSISMNGTLTNAAETVAGFVKCTDAGVYSGGNSIAAGDLPSAINAAQIANGTVTNIEFQYLANVTSDIQTQINATGQDPATQTEQEAGTNDSHYVAPATQQYHPSAAKAFGHATISTGTPTLDRSYNVGTLDDVAEGKYQVNLTVAFSDVYYIAGATADYAGVRATTCITDRAVGYFEVWTSTGPASFVDYEGLNFYAFGDQ